MEGIIGIALFCMVVGGALAAPVILALRELWRILW